MYTVNLGLFLFRRKIKNRIISLLLCTLTCCAIGYGQVTEKDLEVLRVNLFQEVNELREELGRVPLDYNAILQQAAKGHSEYMAKSQLLNHHQKNETSKTPRDRVNLANGQYIDRVGENILYYPIEGKILDQEGLKTLAQEMFTSWKNSPGHYANMIYREYELGDFGFAYDAKDQRIYATHVFGRKGTKIENQLSKDAFGLTYDESTCIDLFDNMILNMGNCLSISGNKVILKHYDKSTMRKMLFNSNDGLAIDLVVQDQFDCNKPNQLDMSLLYDGVLLPPIYQNEIFAKNTAQSDYRLITELGTIPPHLIGQEIKANLLVIKKGKVCSYTVPASCPSDDYDLIDLKARIIEPSHIYLKEHGVVASEKVNFNFDRGATHAKQKPEFPKEDRLVHSISVFSFSSVEGSEKNNTILHNKRAAFIADFLCAKLNVSKEIISIKAKENWKKCKLQLQLLGLENQLQLPKESIRKFVMEDKTNPWDSLLFEQRKSLAVIHYLGKIDSTSAKEDFLGMNLREAILNRKSNWANKAMAELYRHGKMADFLFEEDIIYALKNQKSLVQNYSALLSLHPYDQMEEIIAFLANWLPRAVELSDDAKYNLLQLYAITTNRLLEKWDVSSKTLAKVLHPRKVEYLAEQMPESSVLLNFHLAAIHYYGQVNEQRGIGKSFNYIVKHFKNASLSFSDEIRLCLFFNNWSRYDLTTEFLYSKIDDPVFNESSAIILFQTAMAYKNNLKDEDRLKICKVMNKFNSLLWCHYMKQNFQYRRNEQIKDFYCMVCEEAEE